MKTLGNVLWFILTGLWLGLSYCLLGIIWCITIIGIPFGKQCFKLARLIFWPFGKVVDDHFSKHAILNVIWIIFRCTVRGRRRLSISRYLKRDMDNLRRPRTVHRFCHSGNILVHHYSRNTLRQTVLQVR